MDVKLLRIDSRLVHGQVANNWAGSLGAEAILAVSDAPPTTSCARPSCCRPAAAR